MSEAVDYSVVVLCRNGQPIEIRALKPSDRTELLQAVGRTTAKSLYRRFFGSKRTFSEREIQFFVNIDFVNHVALVAVTKQDGKDNIIGGGRYVVVRPGTAELAFTVVDGRYHGISCSAVNSMPLNGMTSFGVPVTEPSAEAPLSPLM
jgi:hypothetical protein